MGKLLLNLVPGEPFALVQELANFDNPIQLDLFLVIVLDLYVKIRSVVACSMYSWFNFVGVSCSIMSDVSSNGGKYGRRRSTSNTGNGPRNGVILS